MSPTDGRGNGRRPRRSGANRNHLTQAETIRRQQEIVRLRDVERLTWRQVAERVDMGEKEARLAYGRFLDEVSPLLAVPRADEQVAAVLRSLDDAAQQLWRIASRGENESAQVGAIRTLIDLQFRELELRQNVGLIPKPLAAVKRELDYRKAAEQVAELLDEYEVPKAAGDRLLTILAGEVEEEENGNEEP